MFDGIREHDEAVRQNIIKAFTGADIEKGFNKNNPSNERLKRIGLPYGKDLKAKLKQELLDQKNKFEEQSIFSNVNNNRELDVIDKIIELINDNKIKINGRFEVEKTIGKKSGECQKIRWQSHYTKHNAK